MLLTTFLALFRFLLLEQNKDVSVKYYTSDHEKYDSNKNAVYVKIIFSLRLAYKETTQHNSRYLHY